MPASRFFPLFFYSFCLFVCYFFSKRLSVCRCPDVPSIPAANMCKCQLGYLFLLPTSYAVSRANIIFHFQVDKSSKAMPATRKKKNDDDDSDRAPYAKWSRRSNAVKKSSSYLFHLHIYMNLLCCSRLVYHIVCRCHYDVSWSLCRAYNFIPMRLPIPWISTTLWMHCGFSAAVLFPVTSTWCLCLCLLANASFTLTIALKFIMASD